MSLEASQTVKVVSFDRIHEDFIDSQNGLCAICKNPERATSRHTGKAQRLSVDHDHETGNIRGLLCAQCNHMLGQADDNPAYLRAAADYLERTKEAPLLRVSLCVGRKAYIYTGRAA